MDKTIRLSFPFGVGSDPLDVINVWRHVVVKGEKNQIDEFLQEVERRFMAMGWSPATARERRENSNPDQDNRVYCWASGPGYRPRVVLYLNRTSDRRVRGGSYDLPDDRLSIVDLANEIQHVLAEVLEPAAATAGLEVSYPRLGPISRVGLQTASAMSDFAKKVDGQWPLPQHLEPLWKSLVITAFRDDVAISPEELTAWFIASGWGNDAANQLTNRFYKEIGLISEYTEMGKQPA